MCHKAITIREFQKILKNNGYRYSRKKGSHLIFHNENGRQLVINDKFKQTTVIHLIKEYKLVW